MSNQLEVFNFNQSAVKLITENNNPFFNLIDVCDVFGIQNSRRVLAEMLSAEGVRYAYALAKDGKQRKMAFINEPNLYRIIFKSDKPVADEFQNWVFDEVLPTIRKTGTYTHTISVQQQSAIQKAVNERHHRTGEHWQAIYTKLHERFNVPRYQELKPNQFEEVMNWLTGDVVKIQNKQKQFSDDELCTLAWCYLAAERMRLNVEAVTKALYAIKSEYAPSFYSQGIEYKRTLETARVIIERETKHIIPKLQQNEYENWIRVLPMIRRKQIN